MKMILQGGQQILEQGIARFQTVIRAYEFANTRFGKRIINSFDSVLKDEKLALKSTVLIKNYSLEKQLGEQVN